MNNANIERILGLPQGTFEADKDKPEVIALSQIIKMFPWMVDVAEYGYDPIIASLYVKAVAINIQIQDRKQVIDEERAK